MKKFSILALLLLITAGIMADEFPTDTLKVVDIEEVVVIATPKENRKLRELPAAVTLLSQENMQANQVKSIKSLTAIVPNMFIPDYGSRLTSAIYIRGIGSRINTPSVGLYVDNVPYIDKSAFDFDYSDIERIDVLRGPQGTLYGRNTMGGLIRIHTKSPFSYQGTDLKLGIGTYNNYNASLTHYHRISDKFAFSAGGFYNYSGGFFENSYTNKMIDRGNAAGGRIRSIYLPGDNFKIDLNISYEYSDEGGYAYGRYDKTTGATSEPAYNEESKYHRNLLNTGLNMEYQGKNFIFSSVTGFQHLKDRMFIDQDFTPADIYTIAQNQKQSTVTEEISFKSQSNRRWEWVTGVFGFYQWLKTDAPVTFKAGGIQMIESMVNEKLAEAPAPMPISMDILSETMPVYGLYNTPTLGAAFFHQSTVNDLFFKGFSATVGLRVDYEKMKMTHDTHATMRYQMYMGPRPMGDVQETLYPINGKESKDYTQLLPKFALKYEWNERNNIYASASRGYRSGGYNLQMFSDLIQKLMKETGMPGSEPPTVEVEDISYKPEYSWNYELGSHLTLWGGKLWTDFALFYMDTKDQQIARFAEDGFGRMMLNAGKSHSYGAEAAIRARISNPLTLHASYGYTRSVFDEYDDNKNDYKGKYVPFVPRNTLALGMEYVVKGSERSLFDEVRFNVNYNAAGKVYWTEMNEVSQKFYGTLNWRVSTLIGDAQIDLWARNFLNKDYATFYFETMGSGFMQKGRPMQFGVDMRWRF